jgi:hypothetical protein
VGDGAGGLAGVLTGQVLAVVQKRRPEGSGLSPPSVVHLACRGDGVVDAEGGDRDLEGLDADPQMSRRPGDPVLLNEPDRVVALSC